MKKIIALLLAALILLLSGCTTQAPETKQSESTNIVTEPNGYVDIPDKTADDYVFTGLSDPSLLQFLQDDVYAGLASNLASDDYIIQSVSTVYLSKEYIEEKAYNTLENNYFGYKLSDLDAFFEGTRYVFTLGENGETVVTPLNAISEQEYMDRIIRNVAIGSGVILVCVVITVATEGAGAPAAAAIFAASAKTAAICAVSGAVISGVSSGVVKAYQTGDINEAVKASAVSASEGFKWGAITGAISGGASKAISLHASAASQANGGAGKTPSWQESEAYAMKRYKGTEQQVTYLNGKEVPYGTPGATRPDVIKNVSGHLEAIEVKNYNLETNSNNLVAELKREIGQRLTNMPKGTTQRIALDIRGRNYQSPFLQSITDKIHYSLRDIYPNIPIDFLT